MMKNIPWYLPQSLLMFLLISINILVPISVKSEELTLTLTKVAGEHNEITVAATRILSEAYKNIGINVAVEALPSKRALFLSNKGITDGELIRIDNINYKYTELIKVPVSYMTIRHMVWTKNLVLPRNDKVNLSSYLIGFNRGYLFAEGVTQGMNKYAAGSFQQVFKMLDLGRVEVVIATDYTGNSIIRELNLQGISMLPTPLDITPVFHYLHEKNKHLLEKITSSLLKMQRDGRFNKIISQVATEFKNTHGK
ncbi:MAG: transporter substrate-binding domain-containing protein [Colwellia sp.]|nr:transporter substrate-binding domain-containing protein [Colwellia sp.]